jgi:hypothetical protein
MSKQQNDGQLPLPHIQKALREETRGKRPTGMPSLEVLKAETARLGLPDSDAEHLYDEWLTNGFRTARGLRIKSWTASLRTHVRNSWLPSLRRKNKYAERDREAEELARIRRAKERK